MAGTKNDHKSGESNGVMMSTIGGHLSQIREGQYVILTLVLIPTYL